MARPVKKRMVQQPLFLGMGELARPSPPTKRFLLYFGTQLLVLDQRKPTEEETHGADTIIVRHKRRYSVLKCRYI